MENINLYGSICLSDIPEESRKVVVNSKGERKIYCNVSIRANKDGEDKYGHTHFISVAPKKEERKEGVKYIVGNAKIDVYTPPTPVTTQDINNAPQAEADDLPF